MRFHRFIKTLDTIDHNIVIDKLNLYGIKKIASNGFQATFQIENNLYRQVL